MKFLIRDVTMDVCIIDSPVPKPDRVVPNYFEFVLRRPNFEIELISMCICFTQAFIDVIFNIWRFVRLGVNL